MGFEVAFLARLELVEEALALLERVVELEKPLAISMPPANSSKRSATPGRSGCALASGEISTG